MSPILEPSILERQRDGVEIGRLRMGKKVLTGKTNRKGEPETRPAKLNQWRLTSPNRHAIEAAAELLGGQATAWDGSSHGPQWETYTTTDTIPVLVPSNARIDQWYEMWTAGECLRRCTGTGGTNQIGGTPCACPADLDVRRDLAALGKACKPTTRLRVALPNLPGIGLWRVESHGDGAAIELPGRAALLRAASQHGTWVPARLRIDPRRSGRNVYAVPVLDILVSLVEIADAAGPGTIREALAGRPMFALPAGEQKELTAGTPGVPVAVPAAEATPAMAPTATAPAHKARPAADPASVIPAAEPPAPAVEKTPAERALAYAVAAREATARDEIGNLAHYAKRLDLMDEWVPGAPGDPDITLADLLAGQLERVSKP